jgi:hypothetical protein
MAATQDDRINGLKKQLPEADTIEALRDLIRQVDAFQPAGLDAELLGDLREEVFERVRRLSTGRPREIKDLLVGHLLPLCLREAGTGVRRRDYREFLRNWLDDYPGTDRHDLRDAVLAEVVVALTSAGPEYAVSTAAEIGYRDQRVIAALRAIVATHDNELGDQALQAIVRLGVPRKHRDELLGLLHQRAAVRWTPMLVASLQELPHKNNLDLLLGRVRSVPSGPGIGMILEELTLQAVAAIAELHADDANLQDIIWQRIATLQNETEGPIERVLRRNGRLAEGVDTPGVVPTYFKLLDSEVGERYGIIYDRLEALTKPRQLLGWDSGLDDRKLEIILSDACAGSGMVGNWSTRGRRQKLLAWETLLCLGRREAQKLLGRAVASETNGYVVAEIFDIGACLEIDPLPPDVPELIAARSSQVLDEESQRLIAQIGAIGVAHSARTRAAFDALLGYEAIGARGVLLSLVEALADCAAERIAAGDRDIEGTIWNAARGDQHANRRTAAVAALARLLRRRVVRPPSVGDLLAIIRDETLKTYERRELIDAIGHLDPAFSDSEVVSGLKTIVTEKAKPDSATTNDTGWQAITSVALGALARLGVLANDPELLEGVLGLTQVTGGWGFANGLDRVEGNAFVVGLLYTADPDAFAPAAAALIDSGDWATLSRLRPHLTAGPVPAPQAVIESLVRRIRHVQTGRTAEPELFALLARLDPGRLASEQWGGWEDWPPQARAAYAGAVRDAVPPRHERLRLLLPLMGDGQYGVRRAAYRAAVDDTGTFADVCRSWAMTRVGQEAVEVRERAAEAAGWLSSIERAAEVDDLANDPEPTVRRAFARCERERRERHWATLYTNRVLTVRESSEVLGGWRYGRALARVGDDVTLERLEHRRGNVDLPPAVRRWLSRIIKQVRNRWDEATRHWPEPWFARRGRIERMEGHVAHEDGREEPFQGWLWQAISDDATGTSSWGGWASGTFRDVGRMKLVISGMAPSYITVTLTTAPQGITYFSGNGRYPRASAHS